ncbi:uncharacterized protein EDB91DRAFT_1087973 [Suillus paluster]|uniref:uncharacterized protein n=1 Tax=Suillus paluster TaxID=48578 RepID=UPI001B86D3ED|nr:uncharacterized protein EDB91DRAFT_1087973 [Suillus paluster]KAG1722938.1 hypothetical protein EDB91DRAFT_1087973 [Suillus paluster]
MPIVSNDPSWWPFINADRVFSYFAVAVFAGGMYDWGKQDKHPGTADILMVVFPALTFGQEVELIWRQRWSLVTFLYISRHTASVTTIPVTDVGCFILYLIRNWTNNTITVILDVIMITRLHAMYQRSRKVLILLGVVFLIVNIAIIVISAIITNRTISGEELILSGTYQCTINFESDTMRLSSMTWILSTVWEVFALCLAVWIAVKYFRELRRQSTGGILGDCFTVLMKSHVGYFASFVAVSCFELGYDLSTMPAIYLGFLQIFMVVQLLVLGPRLILDVREYHAKLVDDSDAATAMTSIAFQERVHVSTSSSV